LYVYNFHRIFKNFGLLSIHIIFRVSTMANSKRKVPTKSSTTEDSTQDKDLPRSTEKSATEVAPPDAKDPSLLNKFFRDCLGHE